MKRFDLSGRSVLVVGGAGYIGSHVCKALAEAGAVPVTRNALRDAAGATLPPV